MSTQNNLFNGITVIERGNRPTPTLPAKLDFDYVVGGNYSDPYQLCSVYIFPDTQFGAADKYCDLSAGSPNYGLVSANSYNFKFNNYKRDTDTGILVGFDGFMSSMKVESDYQNDYTSASGIFRRDTGRFSVVLNPAGMWTPAGGDTFLPGASGVSSISETNTANLFPNTASGTGGYIDIWTLKSVAASRAQIFVNTFKLNTNNTYAVTSPVEVTTTNKLVQRYVELGSTQRLDIHTFLSVDNEPIKQSLLNLMETGALVRNPQVKITKPGDGVQFDSTQLVKDWTADTDNVSFNNHDTISYKWGTGGTFGATYGKGVFNIQVKYNILDETILSPKFKIIVR